MREHRLAACGSGSSWFRSQSVLHFHAEGLSIVNKVAAYKPIDSDINKSFIEWTNYLLAGMKVGYALVKFPLWTRVFNPAAPFALTLWDLFNQLKSSFVVVRRWSDPILQFNGSSIQQIAENGYLFSLNGSSSTGRINEGFVEDC